MICNIRGFVDLQHEDFVICNIGPLRIAWHSVFSWDRFPIFYVFVAIHAFVFKLVQTNWFKQLVILKQWCGFADSLESISLDSMFL